MERTILIECRDLAVDRPGSPVLRFPGFTLGAGEQAVLLGPSGCGKTTFLSVLAGLLAPSSGKVLVEGRDLYALPPKEQDGIRGQRFGFVFQTLHLVPSLSLRQNIALAGDMTGRADHDRVDSLIGALGLSGKAHRRPDALSQGEQQRAAIARAVLNKPSIIVADEPTSALDDANAHTVVGLLQAQARETGAALLIATHDRRITDSFGTVITLETDIREAR